MDLDSEEIAQPTSDLTFLVLEASKIYLVASAPDRGFVALPLEIMLPFGAKAYLNKHTSKLGDALTSEGATDDRLCFRNLLSLLEWR